MILISRSAARAIFGEVQRWVEHGLRQTSSAYESLVYPLSGLFPASSMLSPLELADVADLRAVVIDDVAVPPDAIKSFSASNCHFSSTDLQFANREFNASIDRQLSRRPRLGVHSKLHSHPFGGGDFLSDGDLHHGVQSATAVAWRHSKGLSTALLHVAYPDRAPLLARRPWRLVHDAALAEGGRAGKVLWRVRSWASSGEAGMQDLGDASIVADSHPLVRAVRRPPYWAGRAGRGWCDLQKAELRKAGYSVSRNLLGRGWRRYLVVVGGHHLLIALPPDLPAARPRLLEVRNALADEFEPLPLPACGQADSFEQLSLLRLVRHFGEPT